LVPFCYFFLGLAVTDAVPGADMATLTKLLANPETAGLLKALVKAMEKEE